jgi:glycerate kinase
VLESAQVIGLAMLPARKFHPFELDTLGLGAALQAAADLGARRCLLGIGGSATNDGGFGLARALGFEFYGRAGQALGCWTELPALTHIRAPGEKGSRGASPQPGRLFRELLVAVDVQNPLLGARGASRVYGPQKGLQPADFPLAERCLRRLARVVEGEFGLDLARVRGAGAAGGLGFGLAAFAGARLEPGFELFARHAALDRRLRRADLVITGEGAIDDSTFMGKGVGQIAERCRQAGIRCIALAGTVRLGRAGAKILAASHALTDVTEAERARVEAEFWLERLAEAVARGG